MSMSCIKGHSEIVEYLALDKVSSLYGYHDFVNITNKSDILRVDCIKRKRPFFILCAQELVPKGFLDPNFSGIWLKYRNFDEKVTWTFSKIDF